MEDILKQNIGIDVAKKDFVACYCRIDKEGKITFSKCFKFKNDKTGFSQFVKHVRKYNHSSVPLTVTMEATGVYHEQLAGHLHKLKFKVIVMLPNKVMYYAKSLNIKTKTDGVDSKVIARMGAEQTLPFWTPPRLVFQKLRSLTRHLQELKVNRLMTENHLEALNHAEYKDSFSIKSYQSILRTIDIHIGKCELQIREAVSKDDKLAEKVRKLETIKGIGFLTIMIILAETQGFALVTSRKQLAAYAGLDVVEKQSGSSVKGKAKISKKGNRRIRAALFFPAMVASKHNEKLREDYLRIIQNKQYKKIGIVAIQRKLLLLIFTLWKNDQEFDSSK